MIMENGLFWPIICLLGILYLIVIDLKIWYYRKKQNSKIEFTELKLVKMRVKSKHFVKGKLERIGGSNMHSKYPDSYILELEYLSEIYNVNDQELFEQFHIEDEIYIKLIEKLDKNKKRVSYKLEKVN